MEVDSSESFTTMRCPYCERNIPSSDFDLHLAHCLCTMERCHKCGEMILRRDATDHYFCNQSLDYVDCSQCNARMESDYQELHDNYDCPLRIVTCLYCEHGFTAVDLFEHQEMCWNRPVRCVLCGYYMCLRDRDYHEIQCLRADSNSDTQSSSSQSSQNSNHRRPEHESPGNHSSNSSGNTTESTQDDHRRPEHDQQWLSLPLIGLFLMHGKMDKLELLPF